MALTYPVLYLVFDVTLPEDHLLPALLWGLATSLLPWFVLYPAFGWGLLGTRAPNGTRPLLSTAISHSLYGLGLGMVLNIASQSIPVF